MDKLNEGWQQRVDRSLRSAFQYMTNLNHDDFAGRLALLRVIHDDLHRLLLDPVVRTQNRFANRALV